MYGAFIMASLIPEILGHLFDGGGEFTHGLRECCESWCVSSPRFCAFAQSHRDKIRKKIRTSSGIEGLRDLQLELDIAYRLLSERRLAVVYEAYKAEKTRGPDFTVSYTTRCTFNIEVRRLRGTPTLARWTDAFCDKLHQLPPSSANFVVFGTDGGGEGLALESVMRHIRSLAEGKDAAFLARSGFNTTQDFFRAFRRLSGDFLIQAWDTPTASHLSTWLNPQAKHPSTPDAFNAIARALLPIVA